jgi:hypothetical protein
MPSTTLHPTGAYKATTREAFPLPPAEALEWCRGTENLTGPRFQAYKNWEHDKLRRVVG